LSLEGRLVADEHETRAIDNEHDSRMIEAWGRVKVSLRSAGLSKRREVAINLGLGHGFLYRPHKEWIGPAVEWAKQS
jgi:hypothetical protein